VSTCFGVPSMYRDSFNKKTLESQLFLGRFWQFWADLAAMAVADNMPSFERKTTHWPGARRWWEEGASWYGPETVHNVENV
jgi:hypothetical protein